MTKVGTGYVAIDADFGPFDRALARKAATVRSQLEAIGDDAGKRFSRSFESNIGTVSTRRLERSLSSSSTRIAQLGRDTGAKFSGSIGDGLARTSRGIGDVDRSTTRLRGGFERLVASMGGGGGNNTFRGLARSLDDFGGSGLTATASLGGVRIALAALIPVAIGFAGAATAAVSALGPLIGLAASAGGALAAVGTGFGVFKLATAGVSEALKEQTTNQLQSASGALSNAGAQRSAARAIQGARDQIRNANEGVRKASENLVLAHRSEKDAVSQLSRAQDRYKAELASVNEARRVAKRSLEDMRSGLVKATQDESRAVLALGDAHEALAKLIAGPEALDVADAQDASADAARNETQAVLNLTKARDELADVTADPGSSDTEKAQAALDLADAENAVGDAQRNVLRTGKELEKLQKATDPADIAKGRLDVASAEQAVADAQTEHARQQVDLNAAEKAGVEGSDAVVTAKERVAEASRDIVAAQREQAQSTKRVGEAQRELADAHRAVSRASQQLSDAQLSAKESMAGAGVAAGKLNDKFDDLSPAAQRFVRVLQGFKPEFDSLRAAAAQGFFPGATAGLKAAMGSFGSIKKVVGETSAVLGEFARKSGELVGSKAFGADIEIIGKRNAKVLDTLGEALRHVISAVRHILVAAGPLTQWLADTANGWAKNAAESAKAGRESGKMAEFFERTRAITERLGSILGHLASGLLGVGKAGTKSGNDIWKSIDRAAARFDKWANSVKGQKALHDFFVSSKELAAAMVPVIAGVTKAIGILTLKFLPLNEALRIAGPWVEELTYLYISWKFASYAVGKATAVLIAYQKRAIFYQAVQIAKTKAIILATRAWTFAQWLLNAALFANPIGLIVLAIAALVAGFIVAYKKVGWFHDAVDAAFDGITKAVGWFIGAIKDAFAWIKDHWELVAIALLGPIGLVIVGIQKFGDDILKFFTDLPGKIVTALKTGAQALADLGAWIVSAIVGGLKAVAGVAADIGGWLVERVKNIVSATAGFAGAAAGVGADILAKIISGLKAVAGVAASIGTWLVERVKNIITHTVGFAEAVAGIGADIVGLIISGLKAVGGVAVAIGGWLMERVQNIIKDTKGFLVAIKDIGSQIVNGIVEGIKGGIEAIKAVAKWLKDEVVGAVKKFFGIDSPSKVFAELGGHMVDGLIKGVVGGDIAGFIKNHLGGIPKVAAAMLKKGALGTGLSLPLSLIPGAGAIAKGVDVAKGIADMLGGGGKDASGSLTGWLTTALKATGLYSAANLKALYGRAMQESGGRPKAINLWDSNAAAGHPSKGLLQTIDSTFDAYKLSGHGNIWDPVDNAIAAIRYMMDRYGHIVGPSSTGYAAGTLSAARGMHLVGEKGAEWVDFRGGERVYTNRETRDMMGDRGPLINDVHITNYNGETDENRMANLLAWKIATAAV